MISIIMIVYEVEDYVEESIKSVLCQTYEDIELVMVAGYGKDRSLEICEGYAEKDQRIKLIKCEAKGIADARNKGLAACSGDYIGFVDSDDYIEPDMYERMLGLITGYDAGIAVCGRFYEYVNTTLSDKAAPVRVLSPEEAVAVTLGHEGFFLHLWDKLYRRDLFDGIVFRTDVTVEDRIVVDTLLAKSGRVVYDPTPLYHFRERSGSNSKRRGMTRNNLEADLLMEEYVKKEFPDLSAMCDTFMLYEFITCLQNETVSPDRSKDDIKDYRIRIRKKLDDAGAGIGGRLRLKAALALYMPRVLGFYTKRRQAAAASKLERFP